MECYTLINVTLCNMAEGLVETVTYHKWERFAGLNFHVFHGIQEYHKNFSMNISASL